MPIKLIAVDMDGTFLNSGKTYNRQRFLQQYAALKQCGIYFVAASGNPLYTLKSYFPEIEHEIAYVAENGAYVVDGNTELQYSHFAPERLTAILSELYPRYADQLVLCAKHCVYISRHVPQSTREKLNVYFKKLQCVDDLSQLDELICKVTLIISPDDFEAISSDLQMTAYVRQQQVHMVSSGFGFIDLIIPGKHKAYGLQILQQRWGIADEDVLAIGDNYNDMEMVQKAGYGFAMSNAVAELKQIAGYQTGSNEQQAVLDVIDQVLHGKIFPVEMTGLSGEKI
ncbi:Cof-type HAD-IIB family hydrolase [Acinetobacter sp. WZC-1]|uniref:Cof-type HAD-IIB family hydrolase n=1 Tax=Acinetobacter sp. WZC-1 TaxID=3459034 RepID=UPI00403DC33E